MKRCKFLALITGLVITGVLLVGCTPPTPSGPLSISGTAYSTDNPPRPASDRRIVLCLAKELYKEKDNPFVRSSCLLQASLTTVTDSNGHFEFRNIPSGSYMILYDDTLEDFQKGLQSWDGKTIQIWDEKWLAQFEVEGGLSITSSFFINVKNLCPEDTAIEFLALQLTKEAATVYSNAMAKGGQGVQMSGASRILFEVGNIGPKGITVGGASVELTCRDKLFPLQAFIPAVYMGGFKGFPFLVALEAKESWPFMPKTVEIKTGETTKIDVVLFGSRQK